MSRALVIVGAGPRTTGILLALAALPEVPATEIHVIDPYPAGPGRIWRADQPTEVWMNNTSDEITVYADGDPAVPAAVPGPGLAEWAGERRFVPRRDAAAYLRDAFDRAVAVLTDPATHPGITVTEHRTARSTSPRRTAASGRRVWQTAQNSGPMRCCWPRGISMSTRAIPAQSGRAYPARLHRRPGLLRDTGGRGRPRPRVRSGLHRPHGDPHRRTRRPVRAWCR
ncbi:FAD/NAD(P)-binding protein [Corynebacterium variabile]|uniref:FAD/NAD(P)-binding protein n=1 Tax=Corynebacterium variabile TaxID=1727 RepID=UPI003FD5F235